MAGTGLVMRIAARVGGVHPSARGDELMELRHASFIATNIVCGGLAAFCLSIYFLAFGAADAIAVAVLVWLTMPIGLALILVLTGRLLAVHIASAAHHSLLICLVAAFTGGLSSFAVPWFIVPPIEAALSGRKQAIAAAFVLSMLGLAALVGLELRNLVPATRELGFSPTVLMALSLAAAALYVCLLAVAVEILSRRAEDDARNSTAHYRLLADNATDLISVHETNGLATFVSDGAARLFGCQPGDLLGSGFLQAIEVAQRPAFIEATSSAVLQCRETAVSYRLGCGADGQDPIWVETRCRPIGNGRNAGAVGGSVVVVTRDISEARAREDELRGARDEAESISRAKSRFLANVSHELRTPLNAIIGFSDVLIERLDSAKGHEQSADFARLIGESGTHLLAIVNDLLDMSRIEADRYEVNRVEVSVADVFTVCINMMASAAADGEIDIEADAGNPSITAMADERALTQIVLNLLSNAVKFSRPGGIVTLSARKTKSAVEISIADQGIGIKESDLKRLGKPFVQAEGDCDRKYQGAGLGLSVVKGLVELHGGELSISSITGRGTTTSVQLPQTGPIPKARLPEKKDMDISWKISA